MPPKGAICGFKHQLYGFAGHVVEVNRICRPVFAPNRGFTTGVGRFEKAGQNAAIGVKCK